MDEFNQTLDGNLPGQNAGGGLQFTPQLNQTLLGMAKWVNFISIVQIVVLCLVAVVMLFAGSMMGAMMGEMGGGAMGGASSAVVIVFMLIYLGVLGYITYLLYTSGRDIKRGIMANDQFTLENGFTSMRRFWKMLGILLAVVLVIYALMFLFGLGAMAMMGR